MQWFICPLHFNELPLKRITKKLYVTAAGPTRFCGIINNELLNCGELNVVNFEAIPTVIPKIDVKDSSTDRNYLWDIAHAISSGHCYMNLALN